MLNSAEHKIFSANKYENAICRDIFMLSYVSAGKNWHLFVSWNLLAGQKFHAQLSLA